MPRRRRVTVTVILVLAVITGVGAVVSTWVKRQALDTSNWTNTSSKLLADSKIQSALGLYLANELFTSTDVAKQLRAALPKQAQALAGPAAAGLHEIANRAAPELVARPRVQQAWRTANESAHKQLLAVLNGGGNVVATNKGNVTLDLHSLVDQLAATLGVQSQVAKARAKLNSPAGAGVQQRVGTSVPGELVIMRSDQLATAQDLANATKNLSIGLTIISLGLFALAVWMSRGVRRIALRTVGWCFVGIGFGALLARRIGGNKVVDGLVSNESVKPAAHDAWVIGTSLLYDIAVALIVYGLLLVVSAWLAGRTGPATATRLELAPVMRDRLVLVYTAVAGVYLLVLVWGPTPAFRHVLPILLIGGLVVLGVETIRRQTRREFPAAAPGDGWRAFQDWFRDRFHRGGPAPAEVPPHNGEHARLEDLERLAALHDQGVLTDDEFRSEKASVIAHR